MRKFAYELQPDKTKINAIKDQTGHIRPKCEQLEHEMKEHMNELAMQVRQKTEVEIQAEQENDRSWIRALNTKLYDSKIQKQINDSSNGSQMLKNEIKNSDNRLRAVKSGLPLARVVS